MFVPDAERHEPAGHAVHAPAPSALKKPGAHTRPTPVSVVLDTVCDALTVPVHDPDVHGLGESVRTVVPATTPEPEMTMPTASEPDATAEIVSAVPAIEPVVTGATKPAAQYEPAGHVPEHVAVWRLVAEPYVPAGHGTGLTEPTGQKEPRGQTSVHVLTVRPAVAPYLPTGHSVGTFAAAGQYEPAGQAICVKLAVVGYGQ